MVKTDDICEELTKLSQEYPVDVVMSEFFKQLTADFTPETKNKEKNDQEKMETDDDNEVLLAELNESLKELKPVVLSNKCLKELLTQTAKDFIEHVDVRLLEKQSKEMKKNMTVDPNLFKSVKFKKTFNNSTKKDKDTLSNSTLSNNTSPNNCKDTLQAKPETDQPTTQQKSTDIVAEEASEGVAAGSKQDSEKQEAMEEKVDDSEKKDNSSETEFKLIEQPETKYSDEIMQFFTSQMQELLFEQPDLFNLVSTSKPQSIPSTLKHLDLLLQHVSFCEEVLKHKMTSFKYS